jgi:hypothetical protein
MRKYLIPTLIAGGLFACGPGPQLETGMPSPSVQSAPPDLPALPRTADVLPAGTMLTARMDQTVHTKTSTVGQRVSATVAYTLVAQNGETVIPSGAMIHGMITGLDDSDHPADQALIRLDFDRLEVGGKSYPFSATIESAEFRVGDRAVHARKGALAGASAGAVAGAILSGVELDDILKGAAMGAGAGSVIGIVTAGDVEAQIPAGSTIMLQTISSIKLN